MVHSHLISLSNLRVVLIYFVQVFNEYSISVGLLLLREFHPVLRFPTLERLFWGLSKFGAQKKQRSNENRQEAKYLLHQQYFILASKVQHILFYSMAAYISENPFIKKNPFNIPTRFFSSTKSLPRSPSSHSTKDSLQSSKNESIKIGKNPFIQGEPYKFHKSKTNKKMQKKSLMNPFLSRQNLLPTDQNKVQSYIPVGLKGDDCYISHIEKPHFMEESKVKRPVTANSLGVPMINLCLPLGNRMSAGHLGTNEGQQILSFRSNERSPRFHFSQKMIQSKEKVSTLREQVKEGQISLENQRNSFPLKLKVRDKEYYRAFVLENDK